MPIMRVLSLTLVLAACSLDTPSPTPSQPLFADDFSQNRGFWDLFTEDGASSQIVGGQLAISVSKPASVALSISAINVTNFDVTVSTTFTAGSPTNSFGLVFRYLDNENFYRLDLTGDGLWGVSRRLGDQWISIIDLQASPALQAGAGKTNSVRILARGSEFTFFANNTPLGSATDNNLPVGRFGVFASTFDDPTIQVEFDDVRLVKP